MQKQPHSAQLLTNKSPTRRRPFKFHVFFMLHCAWVLLNARQLCWNWIHWPLIRIRNCFEDSHYAWLTDRSTGFSFHFSHRLFRSLSIDKAMVLFASAIRWTKWHFTSTPLIHRPPTFMHRGRWSNVIACSILIVRSLHNLVCGAHSSCHPETYSRIKEWSDLLGDFSFVS